MGMNHCPKNMRFGPCGGVRLDGGCEVPPIVCPFLDRSIVPLPPPLMSSVQPDLPSPAIVVDVRSPDGWGGDSIGLWHRIGDELNGCVALVGEHVENAPLHDDSGTLAPQQVISILASKGVPVVATITGRDRSLTAAQALMRSYMSAGAAVIHCVTGDHPAALGIDRATRFGTESMELVAVAASAGICASVGESPTSAGNRILRLHDKARAGASLCILNHGGDAADLTAYSDGCRAAGLDIPLVAAVPMIAEQTSSPRACHVSRRQTSPRLPRRNHRGERSQPTRTGFGGRNGLCSRCGRSLHGGQPVRLRIRR